MRYDPAQGPDARAWLELDETEQQDAVLRHHKRIKARAGNLRLHSIIHATVETQLAEGGENVRRALDRLVKEGLDRHEAIHAIGSLVANQIFNAYHGRAFDAQEYDPELAALNAAAWRQKATDDD